MTDVKGRSPRDPNPWYRGAKRYGDIGRHAPPGDELENTRDHERIWHELGDLAGSRPVEGTPYHIKVFRDQADVSAGSDVFIWAVPSELNGLNIIGVEAYVTTVSSSGPVQVSIRNRRTGADVLSDPVVIDEGLEDSEDSTARSSVNGGNAGVLAKDKLIIDVDSAGTGAKGLGVMVMFDSDPGGSAGTGPPGPPGPIGPPGSGTGFSYTHTQSALASTWVVVHNLGAHPSATVVDTGDSVVLPDVHYDSVNQLTLTFGAPTSGKAYLN